MTLPPPDDHLQNPPIGPLARFTAWLIEPPADPKTERIWSAVAFAVGTILLLWLALKSPDGSNDTSRVALRSLVGLSAALASTGLGGTLAADLSGSIKASGGLAVFVLVFYANVSDPSAG